MITVEQAQELVLANTSEFGTEKVRLEEAVGRVLREPILADRDFPPFDRVSMDGIAINYKSFEKGQRTFKITGQTPAGAPPNNLQDPADCLEVATGAAMGNGADTVIPYEQLEIRDGQAVVRSEQVKPGQNVHQRGFDRQANDRLLEPGMRLSPAETAVLATVGVSNVLVARSPKIAILATGDELVDVEATPLPWQIRMSNAYALKALLAPWSSQIDRFHFQDDYSEIRKPVEKILTEYDLILLSGGVSAGKRDFIPDLLRQSGVEVLFHKVTQRPGKPLLFGRKPAGPTVFALPGNPVSAFMCTTRYVIPWLRKSLGLHPLQDAWAFLSRPLEFKPDLSWFVPVKLENTGGKLLAHPQPGHGSGDLANLQDADAFLELPKGRDLYGTEEEFRLFPYRTQP
ncbi:MAG: molybdopterin molybdenumtransferase MoeA [Bacteroidetes bacterium]|nr:MAG: molybdopterin molybdenumtransferase MoeA [Bacteroidota bacterium]